MGRLLNNISPRAMDCRARGVRAARVGPPGKKREDVGIELRSRVDPGTEGLQRQKDRTAARAVLPQPPGQIVFCLRGEKRRLEVHNLPQLRIRRRMFGLSMHQRRVVGLAFQSWARGRPT